MKEYHVNEIFYTLQGEGYWTGRPAVFVRFSRCNLWTGRESDRERAQCTFCDTDFTASEKLSAVEIIKQIEAHWPDGQPNKMVVLTGGEPVLQIDRELLSGISTRCFYIAVETNGTLSTSHLDDLINWTCVSPKVGTTVVLTKADELKVVWPQSPMPFEPDWLRVEADHWWLSPMDGPSLAEATASAVDYVLAHPRWRLNIQTHKVIGVR